MPVVEQHRNGRSLGPSHRLVYREFEAADGGLPYREAVCFEQRADNQPFNVTAERLQREIGVRSRDLGDLPNWPPALGPDPHRPTRPVRMSLPTGLVRQAPSQICRRPPGL